MVPLLPIQFKLIETQGYFIIAVYMHYILPGSLKLQTNVQFLSPESFEDSFDLSKFQGTRRWLQSIESPYPGYCRAPGSNFCLPMLCNCDKLIEIWNKIQDTKKTLKVLKKEEKKLNNTKTNLTI